MQKNASFFPDSFSSKSSKVKHTVQVFFIFLVFGMPTHREKTPVPSSRLMKAPVSLCIALISVIFKANHLDEWGHREMFLSQRNTAIHTQIHAHHL